MPHAKHTDKLASQARYRAKKAALLAQYQKAWYNANRVKKLAQMEARRRGLGQKPRPRVVDDLPVVQRWLTQEQWYEPSSGVR